VPVSEIFREPRALDELRRLVFPQLRSFPTITVWHAGCAAGQEAYSMAILLHEAGLLPRSRIFASDISAGALARAGQGLIAGSDLAAAQPRYAAAGGEGALARHFLPAGDQMRLAPGLMSHISFVRHNLATDAVFCEANLILCCNVLIYFQRALQARAMQLFADSLVRGGRLCLGRHEMALAAAHRYELMPGSAWILCPQPKAWPVPCPDGLGPVPDERMQ
jgi:chemotaxis protein methyltransferase CheR